MQYGVGIIGAGFGQHVHLPVFQQQPACDVIGMAASTQAKAQVVAERCGVRRAYDDWRALVNDDAVDIVSIAVPPALQPQMIRYAAERGKHVLCEKPLGADFGSTTVLRDLSRSTVIAIDFEFPEIPAWQALKSLLTRGVLGDIRHVDLHWHVQSYAHRNNLDNWKTRAVDGGGALTGLLSHSLHYLEWLFGPVNDVLACLESDEARVAAHLRFTDGGEAAVSAAVNDAAGIGHRLEVFGTEATAVLHNPTTDYVRGFELTVNTDRVSVDAIPAEIDGRRFAVGALVQRLIECISSGATMQPGLAEGLRVQQLIESMRASEGVWITVAA